MDIDITQLNTYQIKALEDVLQSLIDNAQGCLDCIEKERPNTFNTSYPLLLNVIEQINNLDF